MKIAILGAGAMGSIYGGYLSQYNDVCFIDVWKDHIDTINREGLTITENDVDTVFHPRGVYSADEIREPMDLVFVFVKSVNTADALAAARNLFSPHTMVLTLQNGWGNAEDIVPYVGEDNLFLGTTAHGATVLSPGHVRHAGRGKTHVGVRTGSCRRAKPIVDALCAAGFDAEASDNVLKMVWTKLMANVPMNCTTAIIGVCNGFVGDCEKMRSFCGELMREGVQVARSEGIDLDFDELFDTFMVKGPIVTKLNRSSMYQDVLKKRKTEVERINGAIVDIGRKNGIPTPYNEVMLRLVQIKEAAYNYEFV